MKENPVHRIIIRVIWESWFAQLGNCQKGKGMGNSSTEKLCAQSSNFPKEVLLKISLISYCALSIEVNVKDKLLYTKDTQNIVVERRWRFVFLSLMALRSRLVSGFPPCNHWGTQWFLPSYCSAIIKGIILVCMVKARSQHIHVPAQGKRKEKAIPEHLLLNWRWPRSCTQHFHSHLIGLNLVPWPHHT